MYVRASDADDRRPSDAVCMWAYVCARARARLMPTQEAIGRAMYVGVCVCACACACASDADAGGHRTRHVCEVRLSDTPERQTRAACGIRRRYARQMPGPERHTRATWTPEVIIIVKSHPYSAIHSSIFAPKISKQMGRRRKKPLVLEKIEITGVADRGRGIGRHEDGRVVFVEGATPGDVVDVFVQKRRKDYLMGKPTVLHVASPHRTEPFCQHYHSCGGCKWQHITYERQLHHKQSVVEQAIRRIGKITPEEFLPIMGAPETRFYRNKLEFSFSNKRWLTPEELKTDAVMRENVLGFHPPGAFDKVVDVTECWLMKDPANAIRNAARSIAKQMGLSFHDARANEGFMRNFIIRRTSHGEVMLVFSFHKNNQEKIKGFLDTMLVQFPDIKSIYYVVNTKVNDFVLDLPFVHYHGERVVEERLGEVRFHIGPKSFFQTNTGQAEHLYDLALDFADLQGTETVYDLYTGIGSIALYAAQRAGHVVGIEEIPEAIVDARRNADLNGITNCTFYAGDVKDILTEDFARQHGKPDLVITDPPRAGMHPDVVKMFLQLAAPRIVYVSCNPATQARDLNVLQEKYVVKKLRAVDMFPQTYHVESVALLELREA